MNFTEYLNEIPVHPVASLFPMIGDEELQVLADDIKENGQRDPILVAYLDERKTFDPVVIDGRNRFKACEIAGVKPEFSNDYVMEPEEMGPWIISHNLHRRHLTTSQKAMVGQGYLAFLKEDAKRRQVEGSRKGAEVTNSGGRVPAKTPEAERGHESESAVQAAKLVGVGQKSIRDADFVVQHDPDLAEQVRDDKIKVSAAAKAIREKLHPKPERTPMQKAEREMSKFLKNDEEVIRLGLEIALEYLGEECPWK